MDSYLKVELRMDKHGHFTRKIIRDGKSTCESGDDKIFLDELLNLDLPEFEGKFGEVGIDGLTEEGEADVNAKIRTPRAVAWTPEPEDDDNIPKGKKGKGREKMGLGFGL